MLMPKDPQLKKDKVRSAHREAEHPHARQHSKRVHLYQEARQGAKQRGAPDEQYNTGANSKKHHEQQGGNT